jgi:hypothetical protein
MGFDRRHVGAVAVCRDFAEKVAGPSLLTAFPALTGARDGTGAKVPRLLHWTFR